MAEAVSISAQIWYIINMSEIKRKHFTFYGQVQGVGFRYRARKAAERVGVTGWVRNEYVGSVTMEIQGTDQEIDQVLAGIREGRYVRIHKMDIRTVPLVEDEVGFRLRRW